MNNQSARLARDSKLLKEAQDSFFAARGLSREVVATWPETSRDTLNRQWCVSGEKAKLDVALACSHDLPCAAAGLISYRYPDEFGWTMIGAAHHDDALREAARSTDSPVLPEKLEVWNGEQYVKAFD